MITIFINEILDIIQRKPYLNKQKIRLHLKKTPHSSSPAVSQRTIIILDSSIKTSLR